MQKPTVIVPKSQWEYCGVKISFRKEYRRNHLSFKFDTVATQSDLLVTICPPKINEIDGVKWVTKSYRHHGSLDGVCMKIDSLIEFNNQQLANNQ
jgi:hypothetical protein